jgi:hypothetical protein
MSMFKRKINPIFVEEEQYNWGERRSGLRVLSAVVLVGVFAALVVMLSALPI